MVLFCKKKKSQIWMKNEIFETIFTITFTHLLTWGTIIILKFLQRVHKQQEIS